MYREDYHVLFPGLPAWGKDVRESYPARSPFFHATWHLWYEAPPVFCKWVFLPHRRTTPVMPQRGSQRHACWQAMSIYHCNVIKAMTGSIENFLQQLERVILCLLDIRIKMLVLNFYALLFSSISFLLYCTKVLIYNRLEVKNNNNSVTGPPYECLQIDCSRLPSSSLGQTGFCLRYTFEI